MNVQPFSVMTNDKEVWRTERQACLCPLSLFHYWLNSRRVGTEMATVIRSRINLVVWIFLGIFRSGGELASDAAAIFSMFNC